MITRTTLAALLCLAPAGAWAEEKLRIGGVEEILLPWGERLPARIDTGAALSSLDARGIRVQGEMVRFRLPRKYGGRRLTLPIAYTEVFKTSGGREERPVVVIEICLGPRRIRGLFNLKDRRRLRFPLLIGRDILRGNFEVDVSRDRALPPACGEEAR